MDSSFVFVTQHLENYDMTVSENTDFPSGNSEVFNIPGKVF